MVLLYFDFVLDGGMVWIGGFWSGSISIYLEKYPAKIYFGHFMQVKFLTQRFINSIDIAVNVLKIKNRVKFFSIISVCEGSI